LNLKEQNCRIGQGFRIEQDADDNLLGLRDSRDEETTPR
jgi:hypothetical protein